MDLTLTREEVQTLDGALTREIRWIQKQAEYDKNANIEIQIYHTEQLEKAEKLLNKVIDYLYK